MKEFQAGKLPSACHEKACSHVRNAPKATNRLFSPDSGRMIGLRVHFAFRWKLETANRDYEVSENGFRQDRLPTHR